MLYDVISFPSKWKILWVGWVLGWLWCSKSGCSHSSKMVIVSVYRKYLTVGLIILSSFNHPSTSSKILITAYEVHSFHPLPPLHLPYPLFTVYTCFVNLLQSLKMVCMLFAVCNILILLTFHVENSCMPIKAVELSPYVWKFPHPTLNTCVLMCLSPPVECSLFRC